MGPCDDARDVIVPLADKAGLKLVAVDDYGAAGVDHGNYVDELMLDVNDVGIPVLNVSHWATKHGAEAMGLGDQTGTLEAGKLADLLVIDGDPAADIAVLRDRTNLLAIFKGGIAIKDELAALSTTARPSAISGAKS